MRGHDHGEHTAEAHGAQTQPALVSLQSAPPGTGQEESHAGHAAGLECVAGQQPGVSWPRLPAADRALAATALGDGTHRGQATWPGYDHPPPRAPSLAFLQVLLL